MAPHHVAYLVSDRSGELVEPGRALDEPTVHVDEATGQGEGVHLPAVDDEELPVQIGARGRLGDRHPELLHVVGNRRVLHERQLRVDLFGVLPADLDFLVLADGAAGDEGGGEY
jgi:hypothetical protein